jgi:molecular chaperone GrpE
MIEEQQFSKKQEDKTITGKRKKQKASLEELKIKFNKVEKELLTVTEDANRYLNFWKKSEADLINYKRLQQEKIADLLKNNTKRIISDLISILDNFQRAIQHIPEEKKEDNYIKGLLYIAKELQAVLEQYGLKKIELKEKFDPYFHEIVKSPGEEIDVNKKYKIEEIEAGYTLNNTVIKPAKIRIVYIEEQ